MEEYINQIKKTVLERIKSNLNVAAQYRHPAVLREAAMLDGTETSISLEFSKQASVNDFALVFSEIKKEDASYFVPYGAKLEIAAIPVANDVANYSNVVWTSDPAHASLSAVAAAVRNIFDNAALSLESNNGTTLIDKLPIQGDIVPLEKLFVIDKESDVPGSLILPEDMVVSELAGTTTLKYAVRVTLKGYTLKGLCGSIPMIAFTQCAASSACNCSGGTQSNVVTSSSSNTAKQGYGVL